MTHKRTRRLYREQKLTLRRRRRRPPLERGRTAPLQPMEPNVCWSMDLMHDTLAHGRAFRTFNVIEDFASEALAIKIDSILSDGRVVRVLEQLGEWHEKPTTIRSEREAYPRGTLGQREWWWAIGRIRRKSLASLTGCRR